MTVLRLKSSDGYVSSRLGGGFATPRRQSAWPVPASRQIQDWTRGMEISSTRRRSVISERRTALPVFSAKGIRWDALTAALLLILLLFVGILLADMGALFAGGERIGKLSAGITSLEDSNSLLRQELTRAMNHPVLLSNAENMVQINETIVISSIIPEE